MLDVNPLSHVPNTPSAYGSRYLHQPLTEQRALRGDIGRSDQPRIGGEPTPRDENATQAQSRIYCVVCRTQLADTADAISVEGHHHHSFINPHGFMYRIRCFASVQNASVSGTPSSQFTWFHGFTWCTIECASCCHHVGWRFDGAASTFFALILDRIVAEDESG